MMKNTSDACSHCLRSLSIIARFSDGERFDLADASVRQLILRDKDNRLNSDSNITFIFSHSENLSTRGTPSYGS